MKITENFSIMLIKSKLIIKELNQINVKKNNFIENIEF